MTLERNKNRVQPVASRHSERDGVRPALAKLAAPYDCVAIAVPATGQCPLLDRLGRFDPQAAAPALQAGHVARQAARHLLQVPRTLLPDWVRLT